MSKKYQVKVLHPNSYRPMARTKVFTNKEKMKEYVEEGKDYIVEVREKEGNGNWEWNEKYSHT